MATRLGATRVTNPNEATEPSGAATPASDVLLECSGNASALRSAIKSVAPAGRVVLVGMGGDEYPMPMSLVQERELVVAGTFRYAHTWPTAIAMVASGSIRVDELVTSHHGIEQVGEALTVARQNPLSINLWFTLADPRCEPARRAATPTEPRSVTACSDAARRRTTGPPSVSSPARCRSGP
jgi:L-iditol 2-dehydrogenase